MQQHMGETIHPQLAIDNGFQQRGKMSGQTKNTNFASPPRSYINNFAFSTSLVKPPVKPQTPHVLRSSKTR